MSTNRFWQLAARQQLGSITPQEQEELERYLAQHPEQAYQLRLIQGLRPGPDDLDKAAAEPGNTWMRLQQQLEEEAPEQAEPLQAKRSVYKNWLRLTAAAACLLLAGAYAWHHWPAPAQKAAPALQPGPALATSNAVRNHITLEDGTRVMLNAGSRLTCQQGFGRSGREVFLEGEAFFDVAANEELPFVIHAGGLDVKVLGTAFNIRAYAQENLTEATLVRGKIEVTVNGDQEKKIVLHPNEKLTFSATTGIRIAAPAPVTGARPVTAALTRDSAMAPLLVETAWTSNRLAFKEESFAVIAGKLERWYDVQIVFADSTLRHEVLSGIFEKENIEQVLNILRMTTDFTYEHQQRKYILNRKKERSAQQ